MLLKTQWRKKKVKRLVADGYVFVKESSARRLDVENGGEFIVLENATGASGALHWEKVKGEVT